MHVRVAGFVQSGRILSPDTPTVLSSFRAAGVSHPVPPAWTRTVNSDAGTAISPGTVPARICLLRPRLLIRFTRIQVHSDHPSGDIPQVRGRRQAARPSLTQGNGSLGPYRQPPSGPGSVIGCPRSVPPLGPGKTFLNGSFTGMEPGGLRELFRFPARRRPAAGGRKGSANRPGQAPYFFSLNALASMSAMR
jgi:hypothetical protein